MKLSHSRVDTHKQCPYKYKLRYVDKMKTLPTDDPASPLILGHALHTGIEKDVKSAIDEYYSQYPIINDKHVTEAIKLEYWIPKVKELLPVGIHEVKIEDNDFIGFIDLLVPITKIPVFNTENELIDYKPLEEAGYNTNYEYYDLYDFKYSNNVDNYMESGQLHEYKYYFEKLNPTKRIRNLYFVFIPKCNLRIKYQNKTNPRDETLYEFRERVIEDLDSKNIEIVEVEYNPNKVIEFLINGKHTIEESVYDKKPSRLCDWCEYQRYCEKGDMIDMALPKNERQEVGKTNYMKGWIYGAPFSGKTTFLDKAPDPLNLNTDGNTKYVTMQRLYIRDEVTTTGRITHRKFAWEVFKEAISDLEKGSDFKTIIVDLIEDTREMCRLYMYNKLDIQHESDSGFGKGWDIIKTEYLSTMRRLLQLDYNIFLVSHEDISKDLTKKSGEKITRIAPNIQEAIANKLAGMVDFVARVIVNDDDTRTLSFYHNEVTFGGGRLGIKETAIPLEWEELVKVYDEATANVKPQKIEKSEAEKIADAAPFDITPEEVEVAIKKKEDAETPEEPKPRVRKPREVVEEAKEETTPTRRRRKRTE